ncbi:MAG: ATP-binding protein [Candidatus Paceibacterota bacterium]
MLIKNHPNAGKLLSSLRNTGYDSNYTAVEDIVDNSIDAGATNVNVSINTIDKDLRIIIADNGSGMAEHVLDQALKLGSATQKDEMSDLGKYGMGLCTASISMAKGLQVITKQTNGDYLYSSQDLDEIVEADDFIKELRKAKEEEISLFKEYIKEDHGTIVVLSKVDRLTNTNQTIFANLLAKDVGRIYRKFIDAGISISVNGKKVKATDPLMTEMEGTQIYSDEEYEVPSFAGKEKIRVKIAILPAVNETLESELKMNIRSQGFYVVRNNREIANGETLDVFKKHNDFNRLRIELSFTSNLDNEMGVRFTKNGVFPNQAISDFLKQEVGGQITSLRKMFQKLQKADKSQEIDHSESAAVIAKKSKLLITPEKVIERREARINTTDRVIKPETTELRTRNPKETKLSPNGLGARFETLSMGREGAIYDCYQEGKVIVVEWNVDHPFYEKIVLVNKDRKDITAGIDFLIYALASAELKTSNDDNAELISTIKSIMSSNLRALLS